MIELTFYAPWHIALLTLVGIGVAVVAGIRGRAMPAMPTMLLGAWIGLGILITLVYAATPRAGNSPRVIIPALPALAVLFAAGLFRLPPRVRHVLSVYLIALFTVVNIIVIGYESVRFGVPIRAAEPAFAALRETERGFVLTPLYWETLLYTRQPATWFEGDPDFEHNIMHNMTNFKVYIESNPIRYVLIPRTGDITSPEVRAYLARHARAIDSGEMTLYVITKP